MSYSAACLFVPPIPHAVDAVRQALPGFDLRLFSGVMGHVPTDMGKPGLIGCTWKTACTHREPDDCWRDYDEFENCHLRLLSAGITVSRGVPATRVLVLRVDCAGGWDYCRVVVNEDGRLIYDQIANLDPDAYARAIDEGVGLLGIRLNGGYFPPLVRNAFDTFGESCP